MALAIGFSGASAKQAENEGEFAFDRRVRPLHPRADCMARSDSSSERVKSFWAPGEKPAALVVRLEPHPDQPADGFGARWNFRTVLLSNKLIDRF